MILPNGGKVGRRQFFFTNPDFGRGFFMSDLCPGDAVMNLITLKGLKPLSEISPF
jgi:hypothetical protein